jgi:hypothetical protein
LYSSFSKGEHHDEAYYVPRDSGHHRILCFFPLFGAVDDSAAPMSAAAPADNLSSGGLAVTRLSLFGYGARVEQVSKQAVVEGQALVLIDTRTELLLSCTSKSGCPWIDTVRIRADYSIRRGKLGADLA